MHKFLFLSLLFLTTVVSANGEKQVLGEATKRFQTYYWPAVKPTQHTVFLLSGPNDHWNSDAAWWVTLVPALQSYANVVAVERPGIGLGNTEPQLGYLAFSEQVKTAIDAFPAERFSIIAFASANMTVLQLVQDNPALSPEKVVLIDPDVLTAFSVARYQQDAAPFKENLQKYTEYLSAGKYIARVQEKNAAELALIQTMVPLLGEQQEKWLQQIFAARENITNQINLFSEIAIYGDDLQAALSLTWPEDLELVILDTDFEQGYINRNDDAEAITGLQMWRKDARKHYENLTAGSNRQLLILDTEEHLVMIEQPQLVADLIK